MEFLIDRGFKYIIASLNYAGAWTDDSLKELSRQYKQLARYYEQLTLKEHKFYFSPFEMKLATHIKGKDINCYRCALAQRQISVAPDGTIYPCVQFVQDGVSNKEFGIGDVVNGIDESKRMALYKMSRNSCR